MTRKSRNLGATFRIYVELYPSVSSRDLTLHELSPLMSASATMTRVNVLRVTQTPAQLASFVAELDNAPVDSRYELIVSLGSTEDDE